MRYLPTDGELDLPIPVQLSDTDKEEGQHPATSAELVMLHLEEYEPGRVVLSVEGLRGLNAAVDLLKAAPENGHYVVSEEDWLTMRRVVGIVGPQMKVYSRNTPVVIDALDALEELPES